MKVTGKTESSQYYRPPLKRGVRPQGKMFVLSFLFDLSDPRRELDVYAAIKHALFSPRRTKFGHGDQVTEEVVAQRAKESPRNAKST